MSCKQKLSRIINGFNTSSGYRKAMFVFIVAVMLYAIGISTYQVLFIKQWLWYSLIAVYAIVGILTYMIVDELDGGESDSKGDTTGYHPTLTKADIDALKVFVKYTMGRSGGLVSHAVDKVANNPTCDETVAKVLKLIHTNQWEAEEALDAAFESTGMGAKASVVAADEVVRLVLQKNAGSKT